MNHWQSFHLYPVETLDVFLQRALTPFLEKNIWQQKGTRAFFIRYADERGQHIRLRLRGAFDFETSVVPAFEGRAEIAKVPYTPEPERFGGDTALEWAEEYFHQSTRVVLERMKTEQFTYGDAMFDALRMHLIAAYSAGFTTQQMAWYFGKLTAQWLPLFIRPEEPSPNWQDEVMEAFQNKYSPQQYTLVNALERLWKDLQKSKLDKNQPEWLRWSRANDLILKGLGDNLEKALPSLLHLTNNRLGIQNFDEVYLNFILSKAFV